MQDNVVQDSIRNFILYFTGILYEALPFIVFGAIIAGIVEEMIPQRLLARLIPRNRVLAIAIGCFLGFPSPMCDCGILVVVRRLLRKGVPLSPCVSYLLAGPIINVVTLLSTRVAFSGMEKDSAGQVGSHIGGDGMMALRMGLGFLVAFGTGLIVEWQHRKHGSARLLTPLAVPPPEMPPAENGETGTEHKPTRSFWQRLGNITETALHDFVDVMVFLILGAALASLSRLALPKEQIEELSRSYPVIAIGIMMALAIVLCLCSQADAFVAASFVSLRPASKLAFLVLGPMLDFKLYSMYTRVFRPKLIWTIVISVVVQVYVYSLITHMIWEDYAPTQLPFLQWVKWRVVNLLP